MTSELEWLETLEARVRQASERIRALRQENAELQDRVEELEGRLAEVDEAATTEAREQWEEEREEIRARVARLTEKLESLLEE